MSRVGLNGNDNGLLAFTLAADPTLKVFINPRTVWAIQRWGAGTRLWNLDNGYMDVTETQDAVVRTILDAFGVDT